MNKTRHFAPAAAGCSGDSPQGTEKIFHLYWLSKLNLDRPEPELSVLRDF